jgi:hypothetical protein
MKISADLRRRLTWRILNGNVLITASDPRKGSSAVATVLWLILGDAVPVGYSDGLNVWLPGLQTSVRNLIEMLELNRLNTGRFVLVTALEDGFALNTVLDLCRKTHGHNFAVILVCSKKIIERADAGDLKIFFQMHCD